MYVMYHNLIYFRNLFFSKLTSFLQIIKNLHNFKTDRKNIIITGFMCGIEPFYIFQNGLKLTMNSKLCK